MVINCECGTKMVREIGDHHFLMSGLDNLWLKDVPIWRCPECGAEEVEIREGRQLMESIAQQVIRKGGPLTGKEVRFLRKRMGLKIVELAAIMGVTQVSVSRWETGVNSISSGHDRELRLIYAGLKGLKSRDLIMSVFPSIADGEQERYDIDAIGDEETPSKRSASV